MKQSATLEIEIPDNNKLTVEDVENMIKISGVKCKVTACMNHLKISKELRKQLIKPLGGRK